jgi:hypothetical protein
VVIDVIEQLSYYFQEAPKVFEFQIKNVWAVW